MALGGLDQDEVSLRSALALARRFKAHVGALHARPLDAAKVGSGRETARAAFATRRAIAERATRAREAFRSACRDHRVPVSSRPRGSGVSACLLERSDREEGSVGGVWPALRPHRHGQSGIVWAERADTFDRDDAT